MARSVENQISKQMQNMPPPPPWVEEMEAKHPDLVLCHMRNDELEGLDNLQGNPSIDETTGIREYSALEPLIKNPEVRGMLIEIFEAVVDDASKPPYMEKIFLKILKIGIYKKMDRR